jgi:hypothetical protein
MEGKYFDGNASLPMFCGMEDAQGESIMRIRRLIPRHFIFILIQYANFIQIPLMFQVEHPQLRVNPKVS